MKKEIWWKSVKKRLSVRNCVICGKLIPLVSGNRKYCQKCQKEGARASRAAWWRKYGRKTTKSS